MEVNLFIIYKLALKEIEYRPVFALNVKELSTNEVITSFFLTMSTKLLINVFIGIKEMEDTVSEIFFLSTSILSIETFVGTLPRIRLKIL